MTMFNQIGETGLGDLLGRRLTTPGGSNSPAVAPEVFPVMVLENDRPEWGFLKGELPFGRGGLSAAAGAGAHSTFVLSNGNPASKTLIVVKRVSASVEFNVAVGPTSGTTSSTTPGQTRDSRFPRQSEGLIIIGNILSAARPLASGLFQANTVADEGWIVGPGSFLLVSAFSDNLAMNATILWTERKAQPGELP